MMMINKNNVLFAVSAVMLLISCGNDDDIAGFSLRDRGEVDLEDQVALTSFLETHFYNYEAFDPSSNADFQIEIDTIAGVNANKTPLSSQVQERTITRSNVDYKYYVLNVREGAEDPAITFADSALVSYTGRLVSDGTLFDQGISPIWFDLPSTVEGFGQAIHEFKGADNVIPGSDGTLSFENSGVGAVFMPSGLGYFERTVGSIPSYSPIYFTFMVRDTKINDHDGDGILSIYEDLDNNQSVRNGDNTDGDNLFNYLDTDDDGDGILTRDEDPDPNGDGNPDDALDSDNDGIPDYLDNRTNV